MPCASRAAGRGTPTEEVAEEATQATQEDTSMTTRKKHAKKRTRKPVKPAQIEPQKSTPEGTEAFVSGPPMTIDDWREEAKYLQQRMDAMRAQRTREERVCALALLGTGHARLHAASAREALVIALGSLRLSQAEAEANLSESLQRKDEIDRQMKRADALAEEKRKLQTAIAAWAKDYFAEGDPAREWIEKAVGVTCDASVSACQE